MAHRRRSFVRAPRKAVDWTSSGVRTAYQGVAAGTAFLLETFTPIEGGETVIRTRGIFSVRSDQLVASEAQIGAFGIGVVSDQAESVGITAIPHPHTDASWGGWLYHSYFANFFSFVTGSGYQPQDASRVVIDSKAMRKVGDRERLVTVVENVGTAGFQFWNSERILSKVH